MKGVLCAAWIGERGLVGAAAATLVAFATGTLLFALYVVRHYQAWIGPATLVRCALAAAVGVLVGRAISWNGPLFLAEAIVTALAFLAALVVLREVDGRDWQRLRKLVQAE